MKSGERSITIDRDIGLVGGERLDDGGRRLRARRQCLGERLPHQRRRIVEQHDHGAFGGAAIVRAEIGKQIGARQRAGRFGPLAGRRGADPVEKLTNNHDRPTLQMLIDSRRELAAPAQRVRLIAMLARDA